MFFNKTKAFDVVELIPERLRSGLAISDNKLCISSAIKAEPVVLEVYNDLLAQKVVSGFEFFQPTIFSDKFSHNTLSSFEISNEIQNFAINVWQEAFNQQASDIHIKDMGTYGLIRFRIDGMLNDFKIIDAYRSRELIRTIYSTMCGNGDTSFSYRIRQDARIINDTYLPKGMHSSRIHIEPTEKKDSPEGIGSGLYARLLYDIIKATGSLENRLTKLGFLKSQIETIQYLKMHSGIKVLAAKTGHGKSTALKHIIECLQEENPGKAFFSVEDPPEYHLEGVDQIAVNEKDSSKREEAYAQTIAGVMRSNPDCLLIGEMRYAPDISAGIEFAVSGHPVWTTFHASDAISILLRMAIILGRKEMSNPLDYICHNDVISGLEFQRLIPQLCPHCSKRLHDVIDTYDEKMAKKISRALHTEDDEVRVKGDGCEHCKFTGIKGQKIAAEIIAPDVTFFNLIRQNKIEKAKEYWIKEQGGITHLQHALQYVKNGNADPFITEDILGLPLDYEVSR
jgi:type II secretory ATPase GspE/PulE/Tfp pilus assembly ATPase PilB-like protein